jgi:hypothetical protein
MLVLNAKEEQLVETVRALPQATADQIIQWAARLSELAEGKPIDWSDSWSEEDLRDARAASLQNFEGLEPGAH